MASANIEALSAGEYGEMKELTIKQVIAQVNAVKDLVSATNEKLTPNQIDLDPSSDKPMIMHSFVAFFRLPEPDGLMTIVSVGERSNNPERKLVLTISYKGDKKGRRRFFNLSLPE